MVFDYALEYAGGADGSAEAAFEISASFLR